MVAQLKRGGSRLATIPKHVLWLEYGCGRNAPVRVSHLLASDNPPEAVADVVERVRCSQCGVRGAKDFRIVFDPDNGGSFNAMRGAQQQRDD